MVAEVRVEAAAQEAVVMARVDEARAVGAVMGWARWVGEASVVAVEEATAV